MITRRLPKNIFPWFFHCVLLFVIVLNSLSWWLWSVPSLDTYNNHRRILPYQQVLQRRNITGTQSHSQSDAIIVPEWIHNYLKWHNDTRHLLNESNVRDYKFLVSRCYYNDPQCGGLADRLRALPFLIQVAAMTGRLLMFHWERPYDLSEFLQPAEVDWRLPPFVSVPRHSFVFTRVADVPFIKDSPESVVSIRFQAYKQAQNFFDRYKVNPADANMTETLAPLWKIFFRPTPSIQQRIDSFYHRHNLTVSNYVAMHLRTRYTDENTANDETDLVESVHNALACTSRFTTFSKSTPIFVASDSREASKMALRLAPNQVAVDEQQYSGPIVHLDRGVRFFERPRAGKIINEYPIKAYYSTFVDFYLLMGARCIAIDRGGFGRLAALLSPNPTCYFNHRRHKC